MIRKSDKLVEATMLALQGKLELKENKSNNKRADKFIKDYFQHKYDLETLHNKLAPLFFSEKDAVEYLADNETRIKKELRKIEGIDVNVDDTTTVSVEGNETIVDTEEATVIVNKKEDEFVPETSTDLPMEAPVEEPVVDAPVAPDEDIVEVPADDTVMPEEVVDEPVDTELPEDEEEKEPSIDEMIGESKKVESKLIYTFEVYIDGLKPVMFTDDWSVNAAKKEYIENEGEGHDISEVKVNYFEEPLVTESKKVEKINKSNSDINNAIANPQLKANREKIRQAGYETDKKSVTNPRNGRTFQTKYAPNKDKIDWKNRLEKDKTDYEAIVGPESDKIPNSRKIKQRYNTATYSKADADAYGVKYGPKADVEEGKQADQNEKDIRNKKSRCINCENKQRSAKVEAMKARMAKKARKQEALNKLQSTVARNRRIIENRKVMESKKNEDTEYDLSADGSGRKSFYGKAKVIKKDNGDEELYSYGTLVGGMRGGKPYSKGRFSQTTSSHQNAFFKQRGVDPKKVDVEEGKSCKNCGKEVCECDTKLEARRAKSRASRSARVQEMKSRRVKKAEAKTDLNINEGTPKTEEPVPNTSTKIQEKFSSKSFNEVLTKFYKDKIIAVESVKVTKIAKTRTGLKIEANIMNKSGKVKQKVCLEAKQIQTGKSFDKYELIEAKGLVKENKSNNNKITMTTFRSKNNIIECRYILTK